MDLLTELKTFIVEYEKDMSEKNLIDKDDDYYYGALYGMECVITDIKDIIEKYKHHELT